MPIPYEKGLTSKLSGINWIYGFFETWVKKNTVIGEELSKTFDYGRRFRTLDKDLGTFSVKIYAYDGEGDPDWARDESGNLSPNVRRVCTLKADLSGLRRFLTVQKWSGGQDFWMVSFKVNVLFGGTALKARLTWYEGVSISRFHSQSADIWLCLSGNLARRPFQCYTEFSLLEHACFPSDKFRAAGFPSTSKSSVVRTRLNTWKASKASPFDTTVLTVSGLCIPQQAPSARTRVQLPAPSLGSLIQ